MVNIKYDLPQQEVELLESQLRDSQFIKILGNYPENKIHEELESDIDGNGNGHSSSNGNGHSSGNGNGHSSSNGNGDGNGNGHSSSNGNGNGNGHSEHNGDNGYEEHYEEPFVEQGHHYQGHQHGGQLQPQPGFPHYHDPHIQHQGGQKGEFYGQHGGQHGGHQGHISMPKTHQGATMGTGHFEGQQMVQPEQFEHPGQQFGNQPGMHQGFPQQGGGHPNYMAQFPQGGHPQHHQPQPIQPTHPKKIPPAYEGQTLNQPLHQTVPPVRPGPKEKPPQNFRQQGYQGQEFQGAQGGYQPRVQQPEPQQYHSKGAKANINNPPSQYYAKDKQDYYKGGYQKADHKQDYYEPYDDYDPYYQGGQYYDPASKSQEFSHSQSKYSDQYTGYDKQKDRKPKQPAATEPTIKKPRQTNPPQAKESGKKASTFVDEMSEGKTPKSMVREDRGIMSGEIGVGQTTTSWLLGAASANEKFIDDTVENINRKPGFNRNKKKVFERDRKLEEYKRRVQEAGEPSRKDSSEQPKSDGGQQQAGDAAKARTAVDPKKKPNLDFGLEIDEGESESHRGSDPEDNAQIGEEPEYQEEQDFISDGDDDDDDYHQDEGAELIPEAKRKALESQHEARVAEMTAKHYDRSPKQQTTKAGAGGDPTQPTE